MRLLHLALLLAACQDQDLDLHTDSGLPNDTDRPADTGTWSWDRSYGQAGCGGMDPADPAPMGGYLALTFDDGPLSTTTPQVVETLRAFNVPATFFMVGGMAEDPSVAELVEEIAADPLFDIAIHTYSHPVMTDLTELEQIGEIEDTWQLLETLGTAPEFFRFPYGMSDCDSADLVRGMGLKMTGWNIDTADWCYASDDGWCDQGGYWRIPDGYEDDMLGNIMMQIERFDGGIMLFHDIHQYTADSLEEVIVEAQAAGYTFTSLDDTEAFPLLNAGDYYDFPWVGEPCHLDDDTCWQVEWHSWCEATGHPDVNPNTGLCVIPCEQGFCIERDGTSGLHCAGDTPEGPACLPLSESINDYCSQIPGTVQTNYEYDVCAPWGWVE